MAKVSSSIVAARSLRAVCPDAEHLDRLVASWVSAVTVGRMPVNHPIEGVVRYGKNEKTLNPPASPAAFVKWANLIGVEQFSVLVHREGKITASKVRGIVMMQAIHALAVAFADESCPANVGPVAPLPAWADPVQIEAEKVARAKAKKEAEAETEAEAEAEAEASKSTIEAFDFDAERSSIINKLLAAARAGKLTASEKTLILEVVGGCMVAI